MVRRLFLAGATGFALLGCARFPSNGLPQETRLHFTITFAAPIDDRYIYAIAIRRITDPVNETSDTFGPIPVIGPGSKNGIVEGRPTHLILYNRVSPFFPVSAFPERPPTSADPSPVELGAQTQVGVAYNEVDPQAGSPGSLQERQLDFEISLNQLAKNAETAPIDPATIKFIQFNILSMNKAALTSTGDRVMDALGDSRSEFRKYRQIQVDTAGHNTESLADHEQPGDIFNGTLPPIDIVDWTIDVRTP